MTNKINKEPQLINVFIQMEIWSNKTAVTGMMWTQICLEKGVYSTKKKKVYVGKLEDTIIVPFLVPGYLTVPIYYWTFSTERLS